MTYKEASIAIKKPVSSVDELDPMAREIAVAALKAIENWENESVHVSVATAACGQVYTNAGAILSGERPTPIRKGLRNAQSIASACLAIVAGWDETAGYDGAPLPTDKDVPPATRRCHA